MLNWRTFTNAIISKKLLLKKGAVVTVTSDTGVETNVDMAELAALNSLAASDLAKIDGITDGTGAASKALVLDSSGNVAMPDNGLIGLSRASVAAAGTTAADATAMTDQVNAVTAADGTKGVALPAAATTTGPIWVINTVRTASLKVYPVNGGNDNINSLAEDAAFTMAGGTSAVFIPTSATQWYCAEVEGLQPPESLAAPAAAGTTAADATAMTAQFNAVTAADNAKGVALPAAELGLAIFVLNTVANASLLVYPVNGGNDNINGLAEDAAFTLGPGKGAWFVCTSATQWYAADDAGVKAKELTGTYSVTAAENGTTYYLNSGTEFVTTLPAPFLGAKYEFIVKTAPSGASYTVVTASSANIIKGVQTTAEDSGGDSGTADDTISFVDGQAVAGDRVELRSDGTSWFAYATSKVAAGITFTQASA